jgi:hypothetical protein
MNRMLGAQAARNAGIMPVPPSALVAENARK